MATVAPDLTNQVALVTGSAAGIGRELVFELAKCGADVPIHYRSSKGDATEVANRVRNEYDVTVPVVQADVTDPDSVEKLFDTVEDAVGTVDLLVNNVGPFAPVHWEEMDFQTWNSVLHGNLNSTYLCSKRVLPRMREQDYGRIVNIGYASSDKLLVSPISFPYFVAKVGVVMFTRMLASETSDEGITVNAVSPYVVENSVSFPDELPRGRPAQFKDIAQAVLFFVDDNSGYISGQNLAVDGGWLPEEI